MQGMTILAARIPHFISNWLRPTSRINMQNILQKMLRSYGNDTLAESTGAASIPCQGVAPLHAANRDNLACLGEAPSSSSKRPRIE